MTRQYRIHVAAVLAAALLSLALSPKAARASDCQLLNAGVVGLGHRSPESFTEDWVQTSQGVMAVLNYSQVRLYSRTQDGVWQSHGLLANGAQTSTFALSEGCLVTASGSQLTVFRHSDGEWMIEDSFLADRLVHDVSIRGDLIGVVSGGRAPNISGQVQLFRRGMNGWTEAETLLPPSSSSSHTWDLSPLQLSVSETVVAVSTPPWGCTIFRRTPTSSWASWVGGSSLTVDVDTDGQHVAISSLQSGARVLAWNTVEERWLSEYHVGDFESACKFDAHGRLVVWDALSGRCSLHGRDAQGWRALAEHAFEPVGTDLDGGLGFVAVDGADVVGGWSLDSGAGTALETRTFAFRVSCGVCVSDTNGDGSATVQDIFAYLGLWFAMDSRADVDQSGAVSVQDLFQFLSSWFAGC